jgi:hypothetical protein
MPGSTVPIAHIPLSRSAGRMLTGPFILLLAGAVAVAGGVALSDAFGVGLVAAGLLVVALSLYLALMLLTVRLDVEVATLRLRWLLGDRRYMLVRGPVTRVALHGNEAARLQPRFGAFGWGLGRARLRGSETIDVVRLAPSPSMILVPTDRGRVGVAPASEQQLLGALAAAARIQQRLDEVAERARAYEIPTSGAPAPAGRQPRSVAELAAVEPAPAARRMLTGIERTLLEEHLAMERATALRAAEAERQAAADTARMAAIVGAQAGTAGPEPAVPARVRRRAQWRRPAWLSAAAARRATAPEVRAIPAERLVAYSLAITPALAAGALWLAASLSGRLDMPVEQLRPVALALLAVGPVGALAALAASTWFPRLLGLVTVSALAALGLVGRALLV